jgi:hypothetical protein
MSPVLSAMVKVNWVRAIEVSPGWSSVCIPVPELFLSAYTDIIREYPTHSPRIVGRVQMKWVSTLTQAV